MKLKGVSWIEANFEKLIVGVMLLVCLAVLVLQFVVVSNKVEVGGQELTLGNAFTPAEDAANRAIAAMQNESPPLPEFEASEDFAGRYTDRLGPIASAETPIEPFGRGLPDLNQLGSSDVLLGTTFALFSPPTPAAPVAVTYRAALNPYEIAEIDGLAELLPPEQPFDVPWISVEVGVDSEAIAAAFAADPDGPGGEALPLPSEWWRSKQSVVTVEYEREQRQADGSWGAATIVEPLPGFEPAIDLAAAPANWRELDELSRAAGQNEDVVLRPAFYSILEGETWRPPSAVPSFEEAERGEDDIRRLERQLASTRSQIERQRSSLDGGGRDGDDDRSGGRGGRRGGARNQPEDRNDEPETDRRRQRIEAQLERLETQEADIIAELESLGWSEDGFEGEAFDLETWLSDAREAGEATPAWAHDLRVDQGGVYRYRARLVMANPLFGRAASLSDEQKEAAASAFVRSPWSEWSEPVETGWPEYFFVERASAGAGLGGRAQPTARGELFRFHYGYWRKAVVSLEPGDRFVAEVDLPEGLQIWDTEVPATQQAWNAGENAEQPEEIELLPASMPVSANAWLLDVVPSPFAADSGLAGANSVRFDAVIRGPDGLVSRRSPDRERANPLYQRISGSARAGEDQIPSIPGAGRRERPRQDAFERPDGDGRGRDFVPRPRDRDRSGGGGGGGGAGGG
ncbi:MAG: hypothetical protein AAF937_11200 [Planctomycetota bacterium]